MRIQEAITMEIKEILITEKNAKEAVMDDDSEPGNLEDRAYKEWREEPQLFESVEA
jgi:hypothetical protein